MKIGRIALYAALGFGGYELFRSGKKTVKNYQNIIDHFGYKFKGIHDIHITGDAIDAKVDMQLMNNSDIPLNLSTDGKVVLKSIEFYLPDGTFLGTARPRLVAVSIPAHGYVDFKDIPLHIPYNRIGGLLSNAWSVIQNINSLNTQFVMSVMGKEVTV